MCQPWEGGYDHGPLTPSRFCHLCYGMEWPFWTIVIKAVMLGMVYLDQSLTARPYCWGTECKLINRKFAKVPD